MRSRGRCRSWRPGGAWACSRAQGRHPDLTRRARPKRSPGWLRTRQGAARCRAANRRASRTLLAASRYRSIRARQGVPRALRAGNRSSEATTPDPRRGPGNTSRSEVMRWLLDASENHEALQVIEAAAYRRPVVLPEARRYRFAADFAVM